MYHYNLPNKTWAHDFARRVRALQVHAQVRKFKGRWQVLTGKKVSLELEDE